jgi:putative ABC transport system permease protein
MVRSVLRQGLGLASAGLSVGLLISIAGARILSSMLFQIKPGDTSVYIGVALLLGLVTLAACYIPAKRAASIDPLIALRQE